MDGVSIQINRCILVEVNSTGCMDILVKCGTIVSRASVSMMVMVKVGASRVVMPEVVWKPSVTRQAISERFCIMQLQHAANGCPSC